MFQLQKKHTENVKRIVDSLEALKENKQIEENDEKYLLQVLSAKKDQIEKEIEYFPHKIYSFVDD